MGIDSRNALTNNFVEINGSYYVEIVSGYTPPDANGKKMTWATHVKNHGHTVISEKGIKYALVSTPSPERHSSTGILFPLTKNVVYKVVHNCPDLMSSQLAAYINNCVTFPNKMKKSLIEKFMNFSIVGLTSLEPDAVGTESEQNRKIPTILARELKMFSDLKYGKYSPLTAIGINFLLGVNSQGISFEDELTRHFGSHIKIN